MEPRSRQGRAVLAAVRTLDHPDADQVFAAVRRTEPKVSLATVYRNLDALVDSGIVRRWQIGATRRYDCNTAPHLHLHDAATGRLVDIPLPSGLEAELQAICDAHFDGRADCTLELKGTLKESA